MVHFDEDDGELVKTTIEVVEEDEDEAIVLSTTQKLYRPTPLCRTPIARERLKTTVFLAPLHGREMIGKVQGRRLRRELIRVEWYIL
jgi:hypothetical protein